jgi:hypothetical protein
MKRLSLSIVTAFINHPSGHIGAVVRYSALCAASVYHCPFEF